MKESQLPAKHLFELYWTAWPILVIGVFGIFAVASPEVGGGKLIPGDLLDARFNIYVLEHGYQWFNGKITSFWDGSYYFPLKHTTAFSENHLGSLPIYAISRFAGLDKETAFQVWVGVGYIANYFVCAYVLTRLKFSPLAAAVGASIFAFSLPVIAQGGHAHLLFRFATPLACLTLWRFIQKPQLLTLALLLFWFTWQLYIGIYLGILLAYLLLALCIVYGLRAYGFSFSVFSCWAEKFREAWAISGFRFRAGFVVLVTGFVIAIIALLMQYHEITSIYGISRSWGEVKSMLPRIESYLLADFSYVWNPAASMVSRIPMRHEHQLFIGTIPFALVMAALVIKTKTGWDELVPLFSWAIFALLILTLYVNGFTLYRLFYSIPGISSIRAVTRVILVMLFPVAVLSAFTITNLSSLKATRINTGFISWAIAVLIIVESSWVHHNTFPKEASLKRLEEIKKVLPVDLPQDPILFVADKPGEHDYLNEVDGMLVAQELGWKTINGYSGTIPPGYVAASDCSSAAKRVLGFLDFTGLLNERRYLDLMNRLVLVGFNDCKSEWWERMPSYSLGSAPLSDALIQGIRVNIDTLEEDADQLALGVRITNSTEQVVPLYAQSGNPVRLSWRFLDYSTGRPLSGWDSRRNLDFDVPAQGSLFMSFSVPVPVAAGRYKLELTLVQELLFWLHDKGMLVARSSDIIEVTNERAVKITQH